MSMFNQLGKKLCLVVILLSFSFLLLQQLTSFIKQKPLSGDAIPKKYLPLTYYNWFGGVYQQCAEEYLNENFGFRNFFVRLRNQLAYSLFDKAFAKDVVVAKDGFLYEKKYLEAHAGKDYLGDAEIKKRCAKIKIIQDSLESKGIKFAILFAPGKATFYPEYIPAPYDTAVSATNYLKFVETAKATGIHYLDFNQLFLQLKTVSRYPLYSKIGTHWSQYGMYVAFDSLTQYMEHVSGKRLFKIDYSDVELSYNLKYPDGDIAEGMNLLFDMPHFKMAYPKDHLEGAPESYLPQVLTVGDSYWMGPYLMAFPKRVFKEHEFWYYNKQLYNYEPSGKAGNTVDYDLKQSVEKNDFVFIMSTEATLKNIGWGFVDEVYNMFTAGPRAYRKARKEARRRAEINWEKVWIPEDPQWYANVIRQAKELGITVDSCLQMNAEYTYNERHKNDKTEESASEKTDLKIDEIYANKEWMAQIVKQAKAKGISVDSCVVMNAKWALELERNKK